MQRSTVVLAAVLGTALVVVAGAVARDRVEEAALNRIRARLGEGATIRDLRVGPGRFTVEGLNTELLSGAVLLEVPRVEGTYSLVKALFSPVQAVREVTLQEARVVVDLDRLPPRSGTGSEKPSSLPHGRSLGLHDKQVRLHEAEILVQRGHRRVLLRDVNGTLAAENGLNDFELAGDVDGGSFDLAVSVSPEGVRGMRCEFRDVPASPLAAAFPSLPLHREEAIRFAGSLAAREGTEDAGFDVRLAAMEFGVAHERLGPLPIVVPTAALTGVLRIDVPHRTLSLRDAEIHLGEAVARFHAAVARTDGGTGFEVSLTVPRTEAQTLLDAVPVGLLGAWDDLQVSGDMEASLELALHTARPLDTTLDIRVPDRTRIVDAPVGSDSYRRPFRHVAQGAGSKLFTVETGPGSKAWVPLEETSPFLIHAVLAHEDASFFGHRGFAPWAVETAVARNLEQGRFAFGASTLSMQLARNLFLSRDKTLTRKFREVVATYWIEKRFKKSEILGLYLNVIEYGTGIYGLGQATEHYFGKTPAELTPAEAVFFAVILPSPRRHQKQVETGRLTPYFQEEMESLLRHMAAKGRIDDTALAHGLAQSARFSFGRTSEDAVRSLPLGKAAPLPCSSAAVSQHAPAADPIRGGESPQ